jgi:hypothetical protein
MSNQDNFFTPEEIDRQIDQMSRFKEGERADAEAMAYLRSFYRIDSQQEQAMLDRIWNRVADAAPSAQRSRQQTQEREEAFALHQQPALLSNLPPRRRRPTLWQQLGVLAAAVFLLAAIGSAALIFYALRHNAGGPAIGGPKPTVTVTTAPRTPSPSPSPSPSPTPTLSPSPSPTTTLAPFKVTSVTMSVTPASISGIACGTDVTVTYTATIHIAANSPGGVVQLGYTTNNGMSQNTASVIFAPGETSKTFTFTWSGALPADHTQPGLGGINVTSPDQILSPMVKPEGTCQ